MRWRLFATGAAVYFVALIVAAPATWLDVALQRVTDGRLRLVEASGTVWSGMGQLEVREVARRTGWARPVGWRLRPSALLQARLAYDVSPGPGQAPFPVTILWSRIDIENIDIVVPAAALGLGLAQLAPLGLLGELRLQAAALSLERSGMRGSATVQWHDAGSSASPVAPLGDYELRLVAEGAAIRAGLHTLKGPVQLEGSGSWAIGNRPAFRATATVPPGLQQRLAPFLQLVAVERGPGSFQLQLD